MSQGRRNSTSAIWKAVEKSMVKHPIYGRTFAGTLVRDHLCAIGSSVANVSHGVMNCSGTEGLIQVSKYLAGLPLTSLSD